MTSANRVTCSLAAEFSLVKENILIQEDKITQLYVIQSKQDPLLWFGMLFVDSGIYMGAVIRFNMLIPMNYPNCSCPKIFFDPIPYHPLVDPDTGQLDTKTAFPNWNSTTHKLHQLLYFAKRVIYHVHIYIQQIQTLLHEAGYKLDQAQGLRKNSFEKQIAGMVSADKATFVAGLADVTEGSHVNIESDQIKIDDVSDNIVSRDLESSSSDYPDLVEKFLNFNHTIDVIRMYLCDTIEFKRLTNLFIQRCSYHIYDYPNIPHGEDDNALRFTQWDPYLHETTRAQILAGRFAPTSLFAAYHRESDQVSFVPGVNDHLPDH